MLQRIRAAEKSYMRDACGHSRRRQGDSYPPGFRKLLKFRPMGWDIRVFLVQVKMLIIFKKVLTRKQHVLISKYA